ncbi:DUF4381 domain-containing protein [Pseudidiomarina insulisalsae]|uniref:DUF4381 domain-containing protein n=1 Tax=Pseudidiomarina insulisalsae TaxID=575789 RepID=A0A432YEL9_9GAMM|nr:DUF4381 domain-containing protein [Pseudidiomarina insulisalsae]RUO59400.1 DUF4381 domain-containing protein [Pseudidiomarina insulisalsae]
MIDTPALQEMQQIIAPPAAHWWPLAPGWYLLGALVLAILLGCGYGLVASYRRRRMRRAALRQLHPGMSINAINLLLKQTALAYFPAHQVAGLSGNRWRDFLLAQLNERQAANYYDLLVEAEHAAFQPERQRAPALQQQYYDFARHWLKQALPPAKKQRHGGDHD